RGRGFDDLFAQQQEGREIKGEAPDSAVLPKPSFLVSRPSPLTQGVDAAPFDLAVLFHVNFGFPDLDAPPRHAGHAGTSDLAEGRRGDPPNIAPSNVSTQGGTSIVSASAGSSMPLSPGLMFFAGTGVGTRSSASATPLAAGSNHLLGLAQQTFLPDIASGALTTISYTQVGNNANPFHYNSIPLTIILGPNTQYNISNPTGGSASIRLDLYLDNNGNFASGVARDDLTVTGKVTIGANTFDGTLVTAEVRGFGF